jgi:hypothetical protein
VVDRERPTHQVADDVADADSDDSDGDDGDDGENA